MGLSDPIVLESSIDMAVIRPNKSLPFVRAVHDVRFDVSALDKAAMLLNEIQVSTGVYIRDDPVHFASGRDWKFWIANNLAAFLEETNFFIAGGDLLPIYDFTDDQGISAEFTWRAWGEDLSTWINAHVLPNPARFKRSDTQKPVGYMDFYMSENARTVVRGYDWWADSLLTIVARSVELRRGKLSKAGLPNRP